MMADYISPVTAERLSGDLLFSITLYFFVVHEITVLLKDYLLDNT